MASLHHKLGSIAFVAALLGVVGCGSTGNSGGLFPDRYPLGEKASAIVECNAVGLPRELAKNWIADYIVEPGDGLLIAPTDLDSKVRLPADQTVLPDGSVDLGKYGKLIAAGKNTTQIETEIMEVVRRKEKALKEEEIGFIDVRLVSRQSKVYYVMGEVTSPGKYPLQGSETILDGILTAGGLTDRSSWRDIILVRPTSDDPGQVLRINYGDIVRLGAAATNYQLQPGDRIYIGSRSAFDTMFNCDRFR
jgi:polysaccharide export outer membrane protein